ncbi:hypothetical protein PG984_014866 [Apiospora sp. TS-2023a]
MRPSPEGTLDESDHHEWYPEFDKAREPLIGETEVYIHQLLEVNPETETDEVTLFAEGEDPSQKPNEAAETILSFCRFVKSSEAFRKKLQGKPIAIVHDCDSAGRSRERPSPLTAIQLYDVLSKPRFHLKRFASGSTGHATTSGPQFTTPRRGITGSEAQADDLPDAERRVVFVINIDESVVWSIAATVSPIQAVAMRSFVSNHLSFKASFDLTILPDGPRIFRMSFHLPFYGLRNALKGVQPLDRRGLRDTQDIGFMRDSLRTDVDSASLPCEYIYQAELSCLVIGQDHRTWAAYVFLDNYDDYENGDIEGDYDQEREALDKTGIILDPFSSKQLASSHTTPREFFLRVLEVLSTQASTEWRYTVTRLLSDFDRTRDRHVGSLYDHEDEGRTRRESYSSWINSVAELVAKLRRSLDDCTNAWALFTAPESDMCYFRAPGKPWDMTGRNKLRINIIMKNFEQMSSMLRKLDMVAKELTRTTNEVRSIPYETTPTDDDDDNYLDFGVKMN